MRSPLRAGFPAALLAGFLVVTAVGTTSSASAQDKAALMDARAKFQQATELEQAKQWSEALRLFREVGQVKMTPQVRFHIALCQENLGKLVGALGGYRLAIRGADDLPESFLDTVKDAIKKLEARIPKLLIERGDGAEAAAIKVDGATIGNALIGKATPVDPGGHTIEAEAPGYRKFRTTVTVEEAKTRKIKIDLEEIPEGDPGGGAGPVQVNGQPVEPAGPSVLPWVIGGVGVASLIASGVMFGLRESSLSALDDECPSKTNCPASLQGDYDSANAMNIGFQVAGAVGIVGVGVGVTLLLIQGSSSSTEPAAAADSVARRRGFQGFQVRGRAPGADVAGLSLVGSF